MVLLTESYKTILKNVDEVHLNSNELWNKMINCFKIKGTIIYKQLKNYSNFELNLIQAWNEFKMIKA